MTTKDTNPTNDDLQAQLDAVKAASEANLDDIAYNSFSIADDEPEDVVVTRSKDDDELPASKTDDVPLGDQTPAVSDINIDSLLDEVKSLNTDIESQQLDDNVGSKTKASFEGLKSKYKTKVGEVKNKLELLRQEKEILVRDAANYSKAVEDLESLKAQVSSLEQERDLAKQEAAESRHFRLKYDAENDPAIKEAFTGPMEVYRNKSSEIISDAGLDSGFWNELLSAESSAQVNRMIDDSGLTGLNALDLKAHVENYKLAKSEFNKVTSPEFIEATIAKAKGQHIQRSETQAKHIFEQVKSQYSDHISWLKESKTNKDHNIYVHDKAVEAAQKNFEAFRKRIAPEFQSDEVLSWASHTALAAAAYPFQDKYAKHLEEKVSSLEAELAKATSSPAIKQTVEKKPIVTDVDSDLEKIKESANRSLEDIIYSSFMD